ncbi:MAG TPA: hypothetical protein VME43_21075 [Bryobacteraceae bacterium]|nr:hypothetical protein [Bryobacteraceae bacterium]
MNRRHFLLSTGALAAARGNLRAQPQSPGAPPANAVRSMQRLFTSEVEDKPWFYDRAMWPRYLAMLAENRFSRFNLSFGIGYDFLRGVTDAYFLFAYPFFLSVPGYHVRAVNLPDAERGRNLETLRFISEQTAAHGLQFQLGLWMHGYQWENSPRANYTIEGLSAETHAPYCRDAIAALLRACPAIGGVTLRIHGESGVAEGSYQFWGAVFEGIQSCGRKVEIDLHAKGIDQGMIDHALATGLPVRVSPKFWAEHMGMPYHQADIRPPEVPKAGHRDAGLMALSAGSRSFTRYGYADLMRQDRRFEILWRIWPGTQRLLLWADPVFAAAYARAFQFCGSSGVEIMEPLSFKGRRGSGIAPTGPAGRCAYADASLRPQWDWQKYLDTYRVWGRKLYDPEAQAQADPSLAAASRILPIITTAHMPSAANNNYWPELYTNQSLVEPSRTEYPDTPSPKTFGNTSPLDPQLFSRINDFAAELLSGEQSGKYSPIEVAQWLEDLAAAAKPVRDRRADIDVAIQAGLGRFFAAKFRAGVLFAIYERTGDRAALEESLRFYRSARAAWAGFADRAKGVYVPDITVGELPWLHGHWLDRLPAIDADIALVEARLAPAHSSANSKVKAAIAAATGRPRRPSTAIGHRPPAGFQRGQPVALALTAPALHSARLYYRHVNQAERWESTGMDRQGNGYAAAIPAAYTGSPYPLQYYFELHSAPGRAWLHPGFPPDLAGQPYYVIRAAS